jgi:YHS domain-containing protein
VKENGARRCYVSAGGRAIADENARRMEDTMIFRRHLLGVFAALPLAAAFGGPAFAQKAVFQTKDGAIRGFDAVAYFTENKPVKGKAEFAHSWMGANWMFASAENRDKFKAEPEKYAPQYGGYCAYAMAEYGNTVEIDPNAFTLEGGKLYLNYSKGVQATWEKDKAKFIAKADKNWPPIKGTLKP